MASIDFVGSLPAREQEAALWLQANGLLDGCGKVTNAKIWADVLEGLGGMAGIEQLMEGATEPPAVEATSREQEESLWLQVNGTLVTGAHFVGSLPAREQEGAAKPPAVEAITAEVPLQTIRHRRRTPPPPIAPHLLVFIRLLFISRPWRVQQLRVRTSWISLSSTAVRWRP